MLLKVVEEMAMASGDVGDQGETASASADAQDQENDQEASPFKKARTGGSKLQDMYQQIIEESEITQVTGDTVSEVSE